MKSMIIESHCLEGLLSPLGSISLKNNSPLFSRLLDYVIKSIRIHWKQQFLLNLKVVQGAVYQIS